jgi:putative heme-binding domain-containing protein
VDEELVRRVLAPQHGESVQKAAVGWLEAAADSEAVNIVAAEWPGLSPVIRSEALEMMIRRPARAQLLMEAVKDGRIPASGVGARVRQFLVGHSDSALRALATEIWEGEPLEQGNEAFERLKSAVELEGDFDTGQRIYRERCAACHRSGSEGAAFGPDLEAMRRAGREKNLVNLLDPSREVAPEFEAYQVETGAGETLLGIVARETEQRLVLRLPGGIESSLERSELREVRGLGISAMPPGLCEDLGPEDVAGLLRFVEGSAPEAP